MEIQKDTLGMLELLSCPGFCVTDGRITGLNAAARALFLEEGQPLAPLLRECWEAYEGFEGGCLYLRLALPGGERAASVTRMDGQDVFLLDPEDVPQEFQTLALAARDLREPLSNVMILAERLIPAAGDASSPEYRDMSARMNRGLMQLLRIVGNMSDAATSRTIHQEVRNIGRLMDEIFARAEAYVSSAQLTLSYEGLEEDIYCLADETQLERAVLNLLSNAAKFTPKGGRIRATFTRQGRMLRLSIQDSGSGFAQDVLANAFRRYLRQPALEDRRQGIGLGMMLVRTAAADHGGTVLIDQPEGWGTRVTMTLAIRQEDGCVLRSSILPLTASGWDTTLVELSDCLPPELYSDCL